MGLVGENGAGKSTLFSLLLDEQARYTGRILIDGKDLCEHRWELMNHIGVVSEDQRFIMDKCALENVGLLSCVYDNFSVSAFKEQMTEMEISLGKPLKNMSRDGNSSIYVFL